MALSTFTLLCSHCHHASLECFHLPQLKPCTRETLTPHFPSTSRWPHSFTLCLCKVDDFRTSHKWTHTLFVLSDWFISLRVVSSRVIHACSRCQEFLPFQGGMVFRCGYRPHCSSTDPPTGTRLPPPVGWEDYAAESVHVQMCARGLAFSSFGYRSYLFLK